MTRGDMQFYSRTPHGFRENRRISLSMRELTSEELLAPRGTGTSVHVSVRMRREREDSRLRLHTAAKTEDSMKDPADTRRIRRDPE